MYFKLVFVFILCCATQIRTEKTGEAEATNTKVSLLPSGRDCGIQNLKGAEVSEFPWLVGIVHLVNGDAIAVGCHGSLINSRYVLTSASCLEHRFRLPIKVLLGKHNEAREEVGIEKAISHPNFDQQTFNNDIGLIKLNKTVQYSDYVQPICLPSPATTLAKVGDILVTSGWSFSDRYYTADHKKTIASKLISNEDCTKEMVNQKYIRITENHMCSKKVDNGNSGCDNEDGEPVMVTRNDQWYQEGVKIANCQEKPSDVHTKVANYFDWITETLEK